MATKSNPSKALTLTQARTIVGKFQTSSKVNHARVTSLLPYVSKSAATIVDEVYLAYHAQDANVPYAFGESTIQTALNVAKAWANLPASVKGRIDKADEATIIDALVQVRRSPAKLPDRTIPKGHAVKRELVGKRKVILGGERALAHVMTALAKESNPEEWVHIACNAHTTILGATNDVRRAGKVTPASDDDAATDVVQRHNDTAGDARTGDAKAEKRNAKGKRKSKHERDPLEPAKPGNSPENLPGSSTGERKDAPATRDPLAEVTVDALIDALAKRVRNGYVPTAKQDDLFTRLADAWGDAVENNAASLAGTYKGAHVTPRAEIVEVAA